MRNINLLCFYLTLTFAFSPLLSNSLDTISVTHPLKDGETLISSNQRFELGFFGSDNSKNRYVGIWYKQFQPQTIAWVANRDNPVPDSTGVIKIGDAGNIVISDQSGDIIWSTNQSTTFNPVAQLLDSGNFVLSDGNNKVNYLWQSFDFPTDTLLPGMKIGWDRKTGRKRVLRAWKSLTDPSTGDYYFEIDTRGFPEIFLWNGQTRVYRSGPWNGVRFSGVPEMKSSFIFNFSFIWNEDEVSYSFGLDNESVVSRLVVNSTGVLQRFTSVELMKSWNLFWYAPKDQCDFYRECGIYGVCDANASPVCRCMKGFEPRDPGAWYFRDGSGGCIPLKDPDCRDGDGFLEMKGMKLPMTTNSAVDRNMSLKECEKKCLNNCSCVAYANSDIIGGRGCVIWTDDLVDLRVYSQGEGGQILYIRVASAELRGGSEDGSNKTKVFAKVLGSILGFGILLLGLMIYLLWRRKKLQNICSDNADQRGPQERSQDIFLSESTTSKRQYSGERQTDDLELPLFDFDALTKATGDFSNANKLGQGGFGCVYKGILNGGQEIAAKRLSKDSGQGVEQFKNEVKLIARLQHRNLVRLLGCSVEMEEKILVLEFMPNKSLDSILFDKQRSSLLDWKRRFNIICGIARGLLYLHQDSRFRIIHRDLKASNILLDEDMNPKISDFGMARIFGADQTEANTKRVVGTYGYMAPEYAMDGLFSVKSDVFSFGVLVLEIISGKKNRGFYYTSNQLNLLGHAWNLWREGNGIDLIDSAAGEVYSTHEVLRCIQVGLLCVQERAEDRPNMSSVVLMLSSETAPLPQPKNPGFCLGRNPGETDSSSSKPDDSFTVNQVTVTMLGGR